ncbi:MAG: sigma-70 family RNA polymerase sigma factor [Patescibacteria group bacterium]
MTLGSDYSDEQLAKAAVDDEAAFYKLMQRYEHKLLRYIRRIIKINQETAEDILQETFIKTYRYLNNFDPSLKFSSWIYRIAHNEAIGYWRRQQRNVKYISIDKEENGLANTLADDETISSELHDKERQEKIVEVINLLPENYREVLILRYLEQKDYEEISDVLHKPVGTVSALIHRAKDKIKKLDKEHNLKDLI